ncbi:MAG TPA: 2-oxoacid:acceptor oxidoreductase family protein [Gemmatimonadales bacterium]
MSRDKRPPAIPFPGTRYATDGSGAVVEMETAGSEAAGAYPITPSTQMGEGWAAAVAAGTPNVHGRSLIFFEPEGEHAAAAVTAGMSMTGLRATNFSSGQGIAYMHESLYAAVGKRLTYVLNVACRAMTKHALNVHAGHDDYHAIDDTGFFQVFATDAQEAADLNLIAHRIAELTLNPGVCAQDGFLTSHVIETLQLPERELVKAYLGDPGDIIDSPTPAQEWVFGKTRRRVPEMFNLDYPAMLGVVQNQDSYAQGVAAQRPFYFDHVAALTDEAMEEFGLLTGRHYARAVGYRLDDAEWVLVGQGSVVPNCEVVVDYLRKERQLRIGVLNVTMFRPFPADLITQLLRGKKGVTVLERLDQPLAVDAPLLRELRAAMYKAIENGRAKNDHQPYPDLTACKLGEVPDFYSGCFGLGSRDLQPSDIIAAVDNMLPDGGQRRQFYLSIDFIRRDTEFPKLQIWQQDLLERYPSLGELSLAPAASVNLLPAGAVSIRMHSVGGWGAITTGKNIAMTAADLCGLYIKANPKYGSEKKGQPTTFYAVLAHEPIKLNAELKHVTVVLSPDPNVFRHSNPLAGLSPEGGVFILQGERGAEETWRGLPATARREILAKNHRMFVLDGFKIASDEASDAELRYRMQGAAFMGAFFRASPLMRQENLVEADLFDGIRKQLEKKFGHLGTRVVEDNVRVIRRGYDELVEVDARALGIEGADEPGHVPHMPAILGGEGVQEGIAHGGRFWEQVCVLCDMGQDGIADPFAAISAIPAATSTIRDMTNVRFEVPDFIADKCTGCSQCWVQCPDAAIPGVVSEIPALIDAAIRSVQHGRSLDRLRQIVKPLAAEARKIVKGVPFTTFARVLSSAYQNVTEKLKLDPERRRALDEEFAPVYSALADFPLAKTQPFFDVPESREKGSGGLLSITINPDACKGCNICVDVCPEGALTTIRQTEAVVDRLRRNWTLWEGLPETPDRYVNVASVEEGIGVLSSLLLKQGNYRSMVGGDGSCMGCGEKTVIHLVVSAVNALMLPRVKRYVERLDDLIGRLDRKARELLASDARLENVETRGRLHEIAIPLEHGKREHIQRIAAMVADVKDLKWRYLEGPGGKGRATLGIANATGCSSVWGSTYPYNPYPYPWVNHLFQDAPSIAIGLFEGHMRKMADGFIAVRRAELELQDAFDPAEHDSFFARFDWRQFDDDEFMMCPPILAVGGDGAMLDIGFQNLSRLLASGKPIRVVVLDTQVYSNTGGQACTSGYTGQVSDMAAYGPGQHGKEETRKELALLAMAHRHVFVLQSSQAAPSHLLGGVLRGLQSKYPAVFALNCPCPPEHGLGDDAAVRAAKLALESRAFPLLIHDPARGTTIGERLELDGNPSLADVWPSYDLKYIDDDHKARVLELPVTIADWAATEARFKKHFTRLPADADPDAYTRFDEYVSAGTDGRAGKTPFIYVLDREGHLGRMAVEEEIVSLAEDRLALWRQLKELAGLEVPDVARGTVEGRLEEEFARRVDALRAEHEQKMRELKQSYPPFIARRLAEGLLKAGKNGQETIGDLLARVQSMDIAPVTFPAEGNGGLAVAAPVAAPAAAGPAPAAAAPAPAVEEEKDEGIGLDPYIESERCTSCDECTNLNRKLFAYNDQKQAYVKDPSAGTFRELVMAAERCPVLIIHPGTPLNPKEKDLEKWVKRAERFQ